MRLIDFFVTVAIVVVILPIAIVGAFLCIMWDICLDCWNRIRKWLR